MNINDYLIRGTRNLYRTVTSKEFVNQDCDINRQSANNKIFELLKGEIPVMIARYGTTEIITVNNYLCITSNQSYLRKIFNYVTDNTHTPWWFEDHFRFLEVYSGVFPPTEKTSKKFAEIYVKDSPLIDLLGSHQYYEKYMPLKPDVQRVHLETLYPFFVKKPWTRVLEGKKVLVVHPFVDTIEHQYLNRSHLFENPEILPDFDLLTYRAVQSAADSNVPYKDWFEALETMKQEISNINFDICLLGCGAYGLPLAAHVKRLGKKAVHFGGGLQLLFGIKGKRWDDPNYGVKEYINYPTLMAEPYCSLYNRYWVKPFQQDTPSNASLVDGACYW